MLKIVFHILKGSTDNFRRKIIWFCKELVRLLLDINSSKYRNSVRANLLDLISTCQDVQKEENVKIIQNNERKKKIRFFHTMCSTYNCIKSLVESYSEDEENDILIIIWNNDRYVDALKSQMKKLRLNWILDTEYSAENDHPDIFVTYHSFVPLHPNILNIKNYCSKIIVVSMNVILEGNVDEHYTQLKKYNEELNPNAYLLEKYVYDCFETNGYLDERMYMFGNPKYDEIYKYVSGKKDFSGEWGKLKNKKIILWTTDHGYDYLSCSGLVCFDIYAKSIFEFVKNSQEYALVFRPHPNMVYEMLDRNFLSLEELDSIKSFCKKSNNFLWDDSEDYSRAFSLCDMIIADSGCGIICSALPTLKPICVLLREDEIPKENESILKNYYVAKNSKECVEIIEKIQKKDDMYDMRKKAAENFVKNFDGLNGLRIKEFINNL